MNKQSNKYTFLFAAIVCIVCSLSLAVVSEGLKSRQELNEAIDVQKNILKVVGISGEILSQASKEEIQKMYKDKITEYIINTKDGSVVGSFSGQGADKLDIEKDPSRLPLFVYSQKNEVVAYCFPIVGKGLWSTIYGYLSLERDGKTVRGITFYKHGETPGLGGEIEKKWFTDNFKGKSIYSSELNAIVPIEVVKGKVKDKYIGQRAKHAVDGISGATMTSKGVSAMLEKWIQVYAPHIEERVGREFK